MLLQWFFSQAEFNGSYNKHALLPNRNTVIITFSLIHSFIHLLSYYDNDLQLMSLFPILHSAAFSAARFSQTGNYASRPLHSPTRKTQ